MTKIEKKQDFDREMQGQKAESGKRKQEPRDRKLET
jgi:hypothetical protein